MITEFCMSCGAKYEYSLEKPKFCSSCGTKIASRPELVDGLTYIPAGFLKEEIEFTPHVEIFAYNKYSWTGTPESLHESFDHNGTVERISAVIEAMNAED